MMKYVLISYCNGNIIVTIFVQMVFSENTPATDEAPKLEEKRKIIQLHVIGNSFTEPVPKQTMIWLIGLQDVFSYHLPRMPRTYITQLLFDP